MNIPAVGEAVVSDAMTLPFLGSNDPAAGIAPLYATPQRDFLAPRVARCIRPLCVRTTPVSGMAQPVGANKLVLLARRYSLQTRNAVRLTGDIAQAGATAPP